jgi:hypothetical protein
MEYGITTLARLLESGEIDRIDAPTALTLLGLTATAAELNYCDGVTSAIQDQLNVKAPTYHASTQASYGLATNQLYGHAKASTTPPLAPTATGSIGTTYAIFALSDHAHPLQDTIAGIAGLATRLETPRKISIMGAAVAEAIEFDGSADVFLQLARLDPNYLDSAVPISLGGTGSTTAAAALTALGAAASTHAHAISDVTDLTATLAGKSNTGHAHAISDVTDLQTALDGKSDTGHGHALTDSNITGTLPISKGGTGSTTAAAALTALGLTATALELNYCDGVTSAIQTQLDAKSDTGHTHSSSEVSGLSAYLPLAGGVMTGPLRTKQVTQGFWHYNLLASDSYDAGASVSQLILTTGLSYSSAGNKPIVVRVHGYNQTTFAPIDFDVAFTITGASAVTQGGWRNHGDIIPTAVKITVDTTVKIYFSLASANYSFRVDLWSNDLNASNALNEAWRSGWVINSTNSTPSWTNVSNATVALPISLGGTGSTTAGGALTALGAAAATHGHAISDVTSLQSALDGKASSSHSHAISDVTSLASALSGKSNTSHNHSVISLYNGVSEITSGRVLISGQGSSGNPSWLPAGTTGDVLLQSSSGASWGTVYTGGKYVAIYDSTNNMAISTSANPYVLTAQSCSHTEYHLILGTSITNPGGAYTRYINMPALSNMSEGDRIDLIITNNSAYTVTVYINNNTSSVNFIALNGTYLTAADRVFASGERVTLYAIRTSSGGALCWRINKLSESAF